MLFASDLNALNTNILNNPTSLISPWTANLDGDGFDLVDLGELEFRDETADPTADGRLRRSGDELTLRMQDGRTATVARPWALWADTTGAPAASIGIGMIFQAESADENPSDFGALDFVATDIGAGTEDTFLSVLLRVAGRALDEKYRFSSTAGDGFAALFTHAVTADRTYTLPDATGTLHISTLVRKTADEVVNASSTLQNDDVLLYALAANEVVTFVAALHVTSGTTPDIKFAFTVPAAATLRWGLSGPDMSASQSSNGTSGSAIAAPCAGVSLPNIMWIAGVVVNGANAGNLQLQWAQNTSDASDTTVLANSWLRVGQV